MTNTTDQLRAELTAKEFIKRLELIASDSENGIADLGMGQVFALAKEFIDTPIHEANGWALRFAGDKDRQQLVKFLNKYAATMPRTTLRYALEHFDKKQRDHYLKMKKAV